ncbi:MAG: hypothetical protein QOI55_213 [Actinomycetota bacterium]|nr:hypothetical protein [Actinomycetota bacterium]
MSDSLVAEHLEPGPTRAAPLPWRRLCVLSMLGVVVCLAIVLPSNLTSKQGVADLILPGEQSRAATVIRHDFPGVPLLHTVGHDGQFFYAIARQPMHLDRVAPSLDRPRYRSQRILLPLLAWALHPGGGGRGLVIAMFVIGVAGLFAGGLALGALSSTLNGPIAVAALFPVMPGAIWSLNLSVADALACALVLGALVFDLRGRPRSALLAGIAAVLAKESIVLVLVGYALWRRDRRGAVLAGTPMLVAFAWWCALRVLLPRDSGGFLEFDPGHGLYATLRYWSHWTDLSAPLLAVIAVGLAVLALRKGALAGPLGWAIVLQLGFLALLDINVLAPYANSLRAGLPLLALALVAYTSAGGTTAPPPRADPVSTR